MSGRADADVVAAELSDLAFQVVGRLRAGFNAVAAELDLPPAQALALVNLSGPAPMRELAERLSCDASNVTGIVDGLERRGLAVRRPDPADRRVKRVVLTEEGERRRAALRGGAGARAAQLFDLPDADRLHLRDVLRGVLGVGVTAEAAEGEGGAVRGPADDLGSECE